MLSLIHVYSGGGGLYCIKGSGLKRKLLEKGAANIGGIFCYLQGIHVIVFNPYAAGG